MNPGDTMMIFKRPAIAITAIVLIGLLSQPGLARAHGSAEEAEAIDPHAQHEQQAAAVAEPKLAEIRLPDGLKLQNQDGLEMDLRRDVIGDRVVAVNFVYTSCTTVCPVTSSIFSMVQRDFGARLGSEVALVTITVDPARDTPHRLQTYAKNFNPGNDWNWLTGDKTSVDRALRAFGAYTPAFEDHPAMVLIGDEKNDKWYRLYGFPAPEAIEEKLSELLKNRSS